MSNAFKIKWTAAWKDYSKFYKFGNIILGTCAVKRINTPLTLRSGTWEILYTAEEGFAALEPYGFTSFPTSNSAITATQSIYFDNGIKGIGIIPTNADYTFSVNEMVYFTVILVIKK